MLLCRFRAFSKGLLGLLAGSMAASMILATPVMAQGFFDNFFGSGSFERRSPDRRPSASFDRHNDGPVFRSYSNPYSDFRDEPQRRRAAPSSPSVSSSPSVTFCVRLCDGRYYPIHRVRGADAAELCNSFCPASKTRAFSGSGIDHAVASDGSRYASIPNAFAYRERIVENCTCNGRDSYGLEPLNTPDPTLRPGDIVATNDGFVAYNGNRRNAKFTPIESYRGLSADWRRRLAETRIVPNATPVSPEVIREGAAAQNGRDRRAELNR